MIKRSVLLAILFSSSAASQGIDYVSDLIASAGSETARVRVVAGQSPTTLGVICSYHVTNRASKPIFQFQVGAAANLSESKGLPVAPLHWNQASPGATPAGWSESMGHGPTGYFMGWQAKTSKDLIQPGQAMDFSFEFPLTDGFQCGAVDWNARFAAVFPPLESSPTTLSITLSNLQTADGRQFEGDVSILNLGPNDTLLNLGVTLGNGLRSEASRLSLVFRDPQGVLHTLVFGRPSAASGREDPMVVPLPQKSQYTVHGTWLAWSDPPPEKSTFHVEFQGTPARTPSSGLWDLNIMRYWLGKVSSNEITLP